MSQFFWMLGMKLSHFILLKHQVGTFNICPCQVRKVPPQPHSKTQTWESSEKKIYLLKIPETSPWVAWSERVQLPATSLYVVLACFLSVCKGFLPAQKHAFRIFGCSKLSLVWISLLSCGSSMDWKPAGVTPPLTSMTYGDWQQP